MRNSFGKISQRTRFIRWTTLALAILLPVSALAECGEDRIIVRGSLHEKEEACRAVQEVTAYFTRMGIEVAPEITIVFSPQVFIEFYDPARAQAPLKVQVSGYFDSSRRMIEITSPASRHMAHRKPWRLDWGADIANSILRHEIVHAALHDAMGARFARTSKAWIEFIAYAVQIELMDEKLRNSVLANYSDAAPFEYPERVNQLVYGYDPDAFAVCAFLYAREKGGPAFIRLLVRAEAGFDLGEIFWMK